MGMDVWPFSRQAASRPQTMSVAIRALPRKIVYQGTEYLCEEVISSAVTIDEGNFTPCLIAQAEMRGYRPAIRSLKRQIRQARATNCQVRHKAS